MYKIYVNKSTYVYMQQTLKFTFWFIIATVLSKDYYRKNGGSMGRNVFATSLHPNWNKWCATSPNWNRWCPLPQIEIHYADSSQIEIGYSIPPPNQSYSHTLPNWNYFNLPHLECLNNPTSLPVTQWMWYYIYYVLCNSPKWKQDENPHRWCPKSSQHMHCLILRAGHGRLIPNPCLLGK